MMSYERKNDPISLEVSNDVNTYFENATYRNVRVADSTIEMDISEVTVFSDNPSNNQGGTVVCKRGTLVFDGVLSAIRVMRDYFPGATLADDRWGPNRRVTDIANPDSLAGKRKYEICGRIVDEDPVQWVTEWTIICDKATIKCQEWDFYKDKAQNEGF
jgi:hypothetical protein